MEEKTTIDENNKYCRNCGHMITNMEECDICHTKIITKRINTDNKYKILIAINLILITIGVAIDNGFILLIALLVIITAEQSYSKVPIVKILHHIEVTIAILFLLFITYTFISCTTSCL